MNLETFEKRLPWMVVGIVFVISLGGLAEIVPLMASPSLAEPVAGMKPLTGLQLEGRDLYIREGCVGCHSQMVRPLRAETERYGHYSVAGESVWDHPFLWGSKRTGPDLARVGGRYSDDWHREHLIDPRAVVPESNMPGFLWLAETVLDGADTADKMRALRAVGVPYTDEQIETAGSDVRGKTELDAMVAYLQQLGIHLKARR
ncbi:MAG: cytochrome-c oxidase, cbb3-type subunit II [Proteobacteria bacterium]|nr:cytochrome-c oxidase, cbb3-type subunit II [Pseudomonadota bacterium]